MAVRNRLALVSILVLMTFAATVAVLAQEAAKPDPTPVVSEVVALKLDKLMLADENLQLKRQSLQAELTKLRADAQTLVKSLQQPGYTLGRNEAGQWVYTKAAPAEAPTVIKK